MNRKQRKFLKDCIKLNFDENPPLLKYIYIIPTNKIHDSGYKIMYVAGKGIDGRNYLLDTWCDVIDWWEWDNIGTPIKDLHMDIETSGIIRLWGDKQKFQCIYRISTCRFQMVDNK